MKAFFSKSPLSYFYILTENQRIPLSPLPAEAIQTSPARINLKKLAKRTKKCLCIFGICLAGNQGHCNLAQIGVSTYKMHNGH